jgi:hypothetical protein
VIEHSEGKLVTALYDSSNGLVDRGSVEVEEEIGQSGGFKMNDKNRLGVLMAFLWNS